MSRSGSSSSSEEEEEEMKIEIWKEDYSSAHKILLVGEGDFSFSLCLARAFGSSTNIVATTVDTHRNYYYYYTLLSIYYLLTNYY